jgi:hypothetical protein
VGIYGKMLLRLNIELSALKKASYLKQNFPDREKDKEFIIFIYPPFTTNLNGTGEKP